MDSDELVVRVREGQMRLQVGASRSSEVAQLWLKLRGARASRRKGSLGACLGAWLEKTGASAALLKVWAEDWTW